ncbi:MAG TPA: carboxypeptidase regulatory-like domain-containing protein, partial [Longimicrobiaceae bacterium]|nr:carboxypeptidase regulatory-like domain-containing protein [Longimicrobiaceae bacterium]
MDCRTSLLALTLLALPCPLAAQTVRGSLTGEDTGQPVSGAHVLLRDAQGRVVASANTDASGGFLLRAPAEGSYTLVAERIGYVSTASPPLRLAAGQTVEHALKASPERISLEGIVVKAGGGRARCQTRPREGEQVQVVWNEARKALQSTAATAEERVYRYGARVYERQLDPRSGAVVAEQTRPRAGMSGNPFTTVPLSRLAERGYVEADGDSLLYHAPDAQALLSEEFLDQHCFRLEEPKAGEEGLIGLAFEPVRGRRLPDIQGVLWLDRASNELRRMEYGYTGMESRRAAAEAGGEMEFRRLPGGEWIVSRWRIRMPVLGVSRIAVAQSMPGVENRREQYTLLGVKEEGGEVTSIATRTGAPVQVAAGARLAGVVYDSTRAGGLAGAEVVLVGTPYTARADTAGRYELRDLPEGRYRVGFRSARLDSLGYAPAPVEVTL